MRFSHFISMLTAAAFTSTVDAINLEEVTYKQVARD